MLVVVKRSDTEKMFVFMGFPAEKFLIEIRTLRNLRIQCGREAFEKILRCGVGGRYRRFDMPYVLKPLAGQKGFKHPERNALPPDRCIDRDLPDEKRIALFGVDVTGCESDDMAVFFGNDTGLFKVGTDKHVTVTGIQIEGFTAIDEFIDCRRIGGGGGFKVDNDSFLFSWLYVEHLLLYIKKTKKHSNNCR